jgi:hypothetical protein
MQTKMIRIALITTFILLIPLVARQFTNEVNWNAFDFIVIGVLISGICLTYELIATKVKPRKDQIFVGLALFFILLFIWADLSVGIFNIPGISGN